MDNNGDVDVFHRKSPRALWHEYGDGYYFVTIVTKNRVRYFGEIHDEIMRLSPIGLIVADQIDAIPIHYAFAGVEKYVIMPNHIHAMIHIDGEKCDGSKRTVDKVDSVRDHVKTNEMSQFVSHTQSWLSVVVGGLKSGVSRLARVIDPGFGWQPRYHDHIMRGDDLDAVLNYIESNPQHWLKDVFYE